MKFTVLGLLIPCLCMLSCGDDKDKKETVQGKDCGIRGGVVEDVIDGDTIKLKTACKEDGDCCYGGSDCATCGDDGYCSKLQTVRFMGINAGEIPHGGSDDVEHCLGQEAKEEIENLILHKEVSLVFDEISGCNEKYGRWLAYVFYEGELLQERLVEKGLACLYWYTNENQKTDTLFYDDLKDALETSIEEMTGTHSADGAICKGFPRQPNCSDE